MKEFEKWFTKNEGTLKGQWSYKIFAEHAWKAALEWTRKNLEKKLDEIDKVTGQTAYWPALFIDLELMETDN